MTKPYDAEQRELRRSIEEHLAATRSRSSRPPQSSEYVPEIPRSGRVPQFEAGLGLESGILPPSQIPEEESPRKKPLLPIFAGVVGVIALVTAGLLFAKAQSSRQPAAAASSADRVKLGGVLAKPEQTDRHAPVEPIWVSLSATPPEAEIRLDGRRVSNPYRAAHGRDTLSHYILVSLNGYETLEREVSFAHELELKFALDARSRGGAPRQAGPSANVQQAADNPRVASPDPAASSLPAALPAVESNAGATKPGDDLRGFDSRTNKARDIDETDPYKR